MGILNKIKLVLNNNRFLYISAIKLYNLIVFTLSLIAKFLKLIQELAGYITAKIVFLVKPGNVYFKEYYSDVIIKKKLQYKNISLVVKTNTFWDYWRIFNYEKYPVNELEEDISVNKGNKPIVYYEIGANIGYSALLISKMLEDNGHVYALEVEPTNFKTLCDNIILNKLDNITPINIGIAEEFNTSKFYYNIRHTRMHKSLPVSGLGAHSLTLDPRIHDKKIFCNCLFMPFDSLIKDFKLKSPTHIYIDTHGSELTVFESMKSTITNNCLKKIMIDIEQDDIKDVKDSIIFQKLVKARFKLKKNDTVIGNDIFNDSNKSVFFRDTNN